MADNNTLRKDLGPVTAYAIAVEAGFEGTQEEWVRRISTSVDQQSFDTLAASVESGDAALSDKIDTEAEALSDKIDNDISDEAEARAAADTNLSGQIDTLSETVTGKDTTLRNILVHKPVDPLSHDGTAGQVLTTHGDGTTEWTNAGQPTDAQAATAVEAWLTAHPEATTTVQDGAISRAKLNDELQYRSDLVTNSLAPFFSQSVANDAGTYVIYGNKLYLLSNGHEADVTWENTTKVEVQTTGEIKKLGDDVSGLKSAINNNISVGTLTENRYINKNTGAISGQSTGSNVTGYIKVYPLSVLKLDKIRTDGARGTCFYSGQTDDTFVGAADFSDVTSGTVTVPANANYMRVTGATSTGAPTVTIIDITAYIDHVNGSSKDRDNALIVTDDELQEQIDDIVIKASNSIATISDFTIQGYLNDDGSFTATTGTNTQRTTDFIKISDIIYYSIEKSSLRKVCIYDANKNFKTLLPASVWGLFRLISVNNGAGGEYIRLNMNITEENPYLYFYAVKTGKGIQETLNPGIVVPWEPVPSIPYARLRRPLIAFVLDGEYDMNDDMHDVFTAHNMFCGFAPQYSTEYANNSLSTYLAWQTEGFEILSHGAADLSPETTLTDEQAKASIDRSYNWMVANGLNVKGYIGLAGSVQPKFIPHIAKYFDWAATAWNHAADGATYSEPCMFYGTDRPYYAWRYSMQRSSLDAQKAAVDRALANNGLLLFYGHAKSENEDYFTTENLDALLTYIETVGGEVVLPTDAVKDYFAVRYDDIYNVIHS